MGNSLLPVRPRRHRSKRRRLFFEPLEHRLLLDAGAAELTDDLFEVRQNGPAQLLNVLDNDTFPSGYPGAGQITSASYGSEGGRIEIADDRFSIRYAPPADFAGTETFVYYVDHQSSATVTVTVVSPLAPDEYQYPPDGQEKTLYVLANDPFWADYQGDGRITATSETRLGSALEIAADGQSLIYTPPRDAYGEDAFVYIVDGIYPTEVKIEILNPLEPDRYPEIIQNSENNVLSVLANDHFWPGYSGDKVITHVTQPSGGAVTIVEGGKALYYAPDLDFAGWEHFSYVVDNVYETSVSLQVHRPVQDDRFEVDTNTVDYPLTLTTNDYYRFWNGNAWITRDVVDRITSVGETAHGQTVEIMPGGQSVRYSAPANFEGTDSFEYIADYKYRATVTVDVTRPVRDDYIHSRVYEDTVNNTLDVMQNDFKGNGYQGPKVITGVSATSEGGTVAIALDGRSLIYTPRPGYRGTDTFSYTVDHELQAEVQVYIGAIAEGNYYRFYPDPMQTQHTLHVLSNDHFGPNYPGLGQITAVSETLNGGQVTISDDKQFLRFVPAEGGYDTFTYTVDDKYEAPVTVSFKNFLQRDTFVVDQNSPQSVLDPLANDFRSTESHGYAGSRRITSVGPTEQGGTVAVGAGLTSVVYRPAPDFCGTDSFTYTVDGLMQQTISVQVIRRVRDDLFRVETNSQQNSLPVLVNDLFGADYTGAGRVTTVTATAAGGIATPSIDGQSIVYIPPTGFSGEDQFTYTVDGALKAEVTVWVGDSVEDMLPRFGSQEAFHQFLLDGALERYEHLFGTVRQGGPPPPGGGSGWAYGDGLAPGANSAESSRTHSETNVQVAGVDEADIVETDGDYLYILAGNELIIADAWPATELSIASRVAIEGELIGEYLHGDRLTVVSETWEIPWINPWGPMDWGGDMVDCWWPWPQSSETWVTVYDVSDRQSPTLVEQTKLDGTYVESRRIDDSVFLVLRDDGVDRWLPEPEWIVTTGEDGDCYTYETREQYIQRVTADMDSYLPHFNSYGADGELLRTGLLHEPGGIFQPSCPETSRLVTVVSLDISDDAPGIVASSGTFTTGASEIYGSLDNLYVFDQQYTWEDGTVTDILKFDWDAESGGVEFAAKGRVAGTMLDQFSADESQGYLRIATTISNSYSGNWSGRSENVLFVLQDDGGVLEFVGGMQNLALGEAIRSVRFMGQKAFVTTFRDVDPLFALDLSDPTQPRSCGHITMPGYNSYMQLIDENHLLAVGRNAPALGAGPTQVSLFDIQDLSQPQVIDQYTFERFSTSEAETDHHAFGWFAQHNVLSMPAARVYWERVDEDGDGYRETRSLVREDELVLFRIDVTATRSSGEGIQLWGQLEHDSPVRRSAFIDNVLYSVAENSASAYNILEPSVRYATIEFGFEPGSEPPVIWPQYQQRVRILDDTDMGFHADGHWVCLADQGFEGGLRYRWANGHGDAARWTFPVEPGLYRVAATWAKREDAAHNAPFTVLDGSTPLDTIRLDQESAPDDFVDEGTPWENLGTFRITGSELVVVLADNADEYVVADAIRIERIATVEGRHIFYGNSALDDPQQGRTADDAIATDKAALLPGQTASFANYTSYSRGINGIMVDIAGLPGVPTAADFAFRVGNDPDPGGFGWSPGPESPTIEVRHGQGVAGSDRIVITWDDHVIQNQWLQVTVLATENTGLDQDDVFYFGNAVGESGDSTADAKVNAFDVLLTRNNPRTLVDPAPVDFAYDFNRDGRVNATDLLLARANQTHWLNALDLISVPESNGEMAYSSVSAAPYWLDGLDGADPQKRAADEDAADEEVLKMLLM